MRSPFAATMLDSLQYPGEAKGWSSLFPNASPTALDLIVKLMQFDPNHRMTAMDGLRHPFCAQVTVRARVMPRVRVRVRFRV